MFPKLDANPRVKATVVEIPKKENKVMNNPSWIPKPLKETGIRAKNWAMGIMGTK
jgi:hypothetical protein